MPWISELPAARPSSVPPAAGSAAPLFSTSGEHPTASWAAFNSSSSRWEVCVRLIENATDPALADVFFLTETGRASLVEAGVDWGAEVVEYGPFTDESPLGLMLEVVRAEIPDVRELNSEVDE